MNPLVSVMIIMVFMLVGIGIVLTIGNPAIEKTKASASFQEAESTMKQINSYVLQAASEGNGSSRMISFNSKGGIFEISEKENSIIYSIEGPFMAEYLSRKYYNGMYSISGSDVNCYDGGNYLELENSRISVIFRKEGSPSSWAAINTSDEIMNITQMDYGMTINISNSSIMIDDNPSSCCGNGYSEIMKSGNALPVCIAHFLVNSTAGYQYDVYYTLFSGADFIMVEIYGAPDSSVVTENLATHISSSDAIRINGSNVQSSGTTDQTYTPDKEFISSQSGNYAIALVFAGNYFRNISLNTSYPGDDYIFQARQASEGNRLLISLTNGTWENFDGKMDEISSEKILGSAFGNFTIANPENTESSLFLFYKDIDITNDERIATGNYQINIRNMGKIGNKTSIEIKAR